MTSGSSHLESHRSHRSGWLRAAVLGANDGIISVSSLVVGIAAAGQSGSVLLTGFAGMVAGAMSMAAGEYVSVCSQADSERADMARERRELTEQPEREQAELASIYRDRGLDAHLAAEVARQLTKHDALGAHAREELGITETLRARPLQAALASALAFAAGAFVPIATVAAVPPDVAAAACTGTALVTLFVLGGVAARIGGASPMRAAFRVTGWGALAMGLTSLIGRLFGGLA